MDSFDYLIVGSGPAGISAALKLEGYSTCVIDPGEEPRAEFPFDSLNEALASGDPRNALGERWQMLANICDPMARHPKLRFEALRHVMEGEPYSAYGPSGELLVHGRGSFAAGGMANAWGAQLLRYTAADLAEAGGWPIQAADLEPYYRELEAHIGLSGAQDDLADFLGDTIQLQPAIPLAPAAGYLLRRYAARRDATRRAGFTLGRSRLAVLTQPHGGRPAYDFAEKEFFSAAHPGLYTPRLTLAALRERERITYLGGHLLSNFREHEDHVEVDVGTDSTGPRTLRARHLLLACGAIQTGRIVLMNRGTGEQSLPFMDHSPSLLPVFFPGAFGASLPTRSYPIQLLGTLAADGVTDMMSFYYPGGMLRSDLLGDIPLPMNKAFDVLRVVLSGLLVAQIWEPALPAAGNRMRIDANGSVRIDITTRQTYPRYRRLLSKLRSLGGYSLARLASEALPGRGYHHVATLPMRHRPEAFETHADGRLWDSRRVRVIDGSVLPSLPSKNHSLTIMANAARIADSVQSCGY